MEGLDDCCTSTCALYGIDRGKRFVYCFSTHTHTHTTHVQTDREREREREREYHVARLAVK